MRLIENRLFLGQLLPAAPTGFDPRISLRFINCRVGTTLPPGRGPLHFLFYDGAIWNPNHAENLRDCFPRKEKKMTTPSSNPFGNKVLTIPEVAAYLKLSKSKIYYLVSQKQVPHLKLGRNVRIRESDLQAWLELQTEKMPAEFQKLDTD